MNILKKIYKKYIIISLNNIYLLIIFEKI
jgi:hypothetical protein